MTDRTSRARRDTIRAEYSAEEAEAADAEAVKTSNPWYPYGFRHLSPKPKTKAASEHIPTSALVRRLLTQAAQEPPAIALTIEQVEEIARRVFRGSA
jgi:hypothetical protein